MRDLRRHSQSSPSAGSSWRGFALVISVGSTIFWGLPFVHAQPNPPSTAQMAPAPPPAGNVASPTVAAPAASAKLPPTQSGAGKSNSSDPRGVPGAAAPTTPGAAAPTTPAAGSEVTAAKSPQPINPNDPNVAQPTSNSVLSNLMDPFDYDPRGRRAPFGQPVPEKRMSQGNYHGPLMPLQQFDLNQLSLTGILWNVSDPKAFLKDPAGNVYVVAQGAKIGPHNGYVASIREGEIVIVETSEIDGRLVSTGQVVKINR